MKKKPYIILIIIVVLYFIISISALFYQKINTTYLVFSDSINLKFGKKISILNNQKIPNYKFKIIQNGQVLDKQKIKATDTGMMYKNTLLEEDQIAYRGKINPVNYITDSLGADDYTYISSILKNNNINVNIQDVSYLYKYKIDINQDKIDETIYVVSNNYDTDIGELFSLVVIKEENIILDLEQFDNEYAAFIPYLYFIDYKKDGKVEIIIKSVYSSMMGQSIKILSFQNNLEYNTIYEEVYRYET